MTPIQSWLRIRSSFSAVGSLWDLRGEARLIWNLRGEASAVVFSDVSNGGRTEPDVLLDGGVMISSSGRRRVQEQYAAVRDVYSTFDSPRSRAQTQPLLDELPLEELRTILDVGTGPGPMIEALEARGVEARIVGIDLSQPMLQEAARKTNAHLAVMDATGLAFRESAFDAVLFSFCLFHLPRPVEGLTNLKRVLRSGGYLGVVSFRTDPRVSSRAARMVEELLDGLGASHPPPMPSYSSDNLTDDDLSAMAKEAGFSDFRSWTMEFRFSVDRTSYEILGRQKLRIDSLPREKRVEFRQQAEARLAKLPDEDFEFVRPTMYLLARRA